MASPQRVIIAPSSPPATPPDPRLGPVAHSLHHHYLTHRHRSHPTHSSTARPVVQRTSFAVHPPARPPRNPPRPAPAHLSASAPRLFRFDEDPAPLAPAPPPAASHDRGIDRAVDRASSPSAPHALAHSVGAARSLQNASLRFCHSLPTLPATPCSPPDAPPPRAPLPLHNHHHHGAHSPRRDRAHRPHKKSAPIVIPERAAQRPDRVLATRRHHQHHHQHQPRPPPPHRKHRSDKSGRRRSALGIADSFSSSSSCDSDD